ncbi:MAG TPA: protein kinase, partial [Candidatus Bathyarchaeia archaeon]|nr:protein kinase [Candidatus Bathyarchaeia archaeon]
MKCPRCQAENPDESRFCGQCAAGLKPGAPSAGSPPTDMTTPLPGLTGRLFRAGRVACGELVPGADFAGRYRILDELGRGGMGRVYKALDLEISESIALKILIPAFSADERMVERFRNELKLARRISHKNVCRIFDLGHCEGTYFITMEFVPGDTLKSMIRMMGPLDPPRALAVAGQVCDGLAEAHRLGVVHRDLKSSNIMIDRDGSARIMDFGIAVAAETRGSTDEGALVGTPEYMAPEQVEGKAVRARVSTAYEYLETRFDSKTRALASFIFLCQRGLSVGL